MNVSATILLAFGMSMDAFAASIGKGATLHKPKFSEALRTGLIFGAIETLTPLVGWGLGMLASQFRPRMEPLDCLCAAGFSRRSNGYRRVTRRR
ncbi:membrane protein [Klebsiella grimontii]|uniref:Membrane protein n=1 Tax=Klebsiella grimontii TaxID=2058152 RepID=A0A7H4P1H4_9ENTR|nr:membrane protein [Klebsiella grimontii]